MRDPDSFIGTAAALSGTTGLTIQWATNFGSLAVILLNCVLALAGLALVSIKIAKARRELKRMGDD